MIRARWSQNLPRYGIRSCRPSTAHELRFTHENSVRCYMTRWPDGHWLLASSKKMVTPYNHINPGSPFRHRSILWLNQCKFVCCALQHCHDPASETLCVCTRVSMSVASHHSAQPRGVCSLSKRPIKASSSISPPSHIHSCQIVKRLVLWLFLFMTFQSKRCNVKRKKKLFQDHEQLGFRSRDGIIKGDRVWQEKKEKWQEKRESVVKKMRIKCQKA